MSAAPEDERALRVLMVNKFHFLNGGAELSYFGMTELLRAHGHTVGHFSMEHPENVPSPQAPYFVSNVDYAKVGGAKAKLKVAARTVYCAEARRKMAALLDAEPYDIVHLHNFHHQITPSILPEIRRRGIPIVYSVHDLKPVCGNYRMLTHDGVCERCKGGRFYQQTLHRCTKGSRLASAVNTVEMYYHHWRGYYGLIDQFLPVSSFYGEKLIEFGMPPAKVTVLPDFIDTRQYTPRYEAGDALLYLGRLSAEKGIPTLVGAMSQVPELRCHIAGRGPYEDEVRRIVRDSGLRNIELLGHISGDDLRRELRDCLALVIPSEWYEAFGMCTIEAYASGKPVIGARIGGITETIEEGDTGWLFTPGDTEDLVRAIRTMLEARDRIPDMGRMARQRVEQCYDASGQYDKLMEVYRHVLRTAH